MRDGGTAGGERSELLNKGRRHRLIRRLVQQEKVGTQLELVRSLESLGCEVTQATISRDVRELGLQKGRDRLGRPRYILPAQEETRDPEAACARMMEQFANAVIAAQNLVLVKSEVGTAPGMGRVIDELDNELILGTVAGDDTVLVVTENAEAARQVANYLSSLGG
jgi:transcriptional regulator of arginine metabolism